jgi:hypothetical protein
LERAPIAERPDTLKKISSGRKMHDFEILAGLLKDLGEGIPLDLARRFRRFAWSTAMRYETGRRPTGETIGLLKTAQQTCDWVRGKLP